MEELGSWSELGHCILTIMDVYQWLGQDFLDPIQSYVDGPCHTHDEQSPFLNICPKLIYFFKTNIYLQFVSYN